MKTKSIGYWITTGLVALGFLAGGAVDLSGAPNVVAVMGHLGYPAYFAGILGTWKVLGAVAVLAPRWPRLKEWAYAGMVFDLSGAALSHAFRGDGASAVVTPLVLLALVVGSWALRPQTRVLGVLATRQPVALAPAQARAAA